MYTSNKILSSFKVFIFSLFMSLIVYISLDVFYTDLPPYYIKLSEVNSSIYIINDNNVEVYSILSYKKDFLRLFSKGIKLNYPVYEEVLDFNYSGFKDFYYLPPDNLQGIISYDNFKDNESCTIYTKFKLKQKKEYIHTLDLPYFWSTDAKVEHKVIINNSYKVLIFNIKPYRLIEKDNKHIFYINNSLKQRLVINWI